MLETMSSSELWYWSQKGEYLGDERADYNSASIQANAWNLKRTEDNQRFWLPEDFMYSQRLHKRELIEDSEAEKEKRIAMHHHARRAQMGLHKAEQRKKAERSTKESK